MAEDLPKFNPSYPFKAFTKTFEAPQSVKNNFLYLSRVGTGMVKLFLWQRISNGI